MNTNTRKTAVLLLSTCLTSLLLGGVVVAGMLHYLKGDSGSGDGKDGKSSPSRRSAALVRTTEARWEDLGTIRTYHGRFVQVQGGTISSEVSGMVRALPVEVGTPIVGGQTPIAKIDDTWTKLELERTEAEINSIKIQLQFEEKELRRITPLVRNSTITESDFLTQQTKVDELKAQLDRALVAKKEAEEKLKRTTIYAPFDGHIVSKSAEVGDLMSPGTTIVGTVSSGKIDAVVNIKEDIIDRLKIGDKITILVDQLNTKAVGEVHAIVPYAPLTGIRSFPVYVRMDDQQGRFKVGMSVTALIQTVDSRPGIVVPMDAVIDKVDGQTVWVITEQEGQKSESAPNEPAPLQSVATPVPVKIVATALDQLSVVAETEEGKTLLTPGAQVVIEGGERLMPKQVVNVVPTDPAWFEGLEDGIEHTVIAPKKRLTERM